MKKIHLACYLCAIGLLLQNGLMAQETRDSAARAADTTVIPKDSLTGAADSIELLHTPKKSYWQTGLSYLSDNVYLGRKDSVKIPYLVPTIGYYHKSGLYIDASLGYATIPGDSHIDMVSLEGGYILSKGNFDGQLAVSKFWYSAQSFSVKSEITANIVADASYDLHFIKPTVEATFNFGTATDYGLGLGLQHTFYADKDVFDISPSFVMNIGTQNYYNSYYRKRKYSRTRKGDTVTGTITATVIDPAAFKVLDYEFSLPINYTLHKFMFSLTPVLAIPVNPATVSRTTKPTSGPTTNKVAVLEKLQNRFFWNLGFTYKF
jgi:hypothetical protein